MREAFATRVICDGCGTTAIIDPDPAAPGLISWAPPAGWYDRSNWAAGKGGIALQLLDGRIITDLCPSCLALPMGTLLEAVTARLDDLAARR